MERPCIGGCGGVAGTHSKTGRCRPCALAFVNSDPEIAAKRRARIAEFGATRRLPRKTCADCPTEISLSSKGRCRPCARRALNANPERAIKAGETYRRRFQTEPEFRDAVIQRLRELTAHQIATNPRALEARRENGRKYGLVNFAKGRTPEAHAKAARTFSARALAHIPTDYRELYLALTKQDLRKDERERIVLEHAAAEQARAPRLVREAEQRMRERAEQRQREQY
jgi:hypothetical protein